MRTWSQQEPIPFSCLLNNLLPESARGCHRYVVALRQPVTSREISKGMVAASNNNGFSDNTSENPLDSRETH
jgi:hypothetical protein